MKTSLLLLFMRLRLYVLLFGAKLVPDGFFCLSLKVLTSCEYIYIYIYIYIYVEDF